MRFRDVMADERGFVHKKLLGFVGGLGIPVVSTVAKIGRSLLPGNGGGGQPVALPTSQAQIDAIIMRDVHTESWETIANRTGIGPNAAMLRYHQFLKADATGPPPTPIPTVTPLPLLGITNGQTGPCPDPSWTRLPSGQCVPSVAPEPVPRLPPGASAEAGFGQARMGRYGAALEPFIRAGHSRICPRGAVLALDGLCYNRKDIRNSERWWPRGRRPLLTGGEMRAISIASGAAKKLQRKQKQLRELGLLKAPPARRTQKRLPPGHHAHAAHD